MPEWWINASGLFFILGSVAVIASLVLCIILAHVVLELSAQVKKLTAKVEELTDRTKSIAENVDSLTKDVSMRATGIVKVVDDNAHKAFDVIEKAAPFVIVAGMALRLFGLVKRGSKASRGRKKRS